MEKSKKIIFLEKILSFIAKKILKRHVPQVIAVTGSVGKTGTKEMIAHLLSDYYFVRQNNKNYNNEIGLPLTIIGAESGGRSILRWALVFLKGAQVAFFSKDYPEVLVLEMGADRKGDLQYLCQITPPDVGVITNIGNSHLEYFKTRASLAREKSILLKSIKSGGLAIINEDDTEVAKIGQQIGEKVLTVGINSPAQMRATDIKFAKRTLRLGNGKSMSVVSGLVFKLNYQGKIVPVKLKYSFGAPAVYSALIALAATEFFQINIVEAAQSLENFRLSKGRLSLVEGIKRTIIIDDTYNSAPKSLEEALMVLGECKATKKIAVIGDMLELGREEKKSHQKVGQDLSKFGVDVFIAVGKRMRLAYDECLKKSKKIKVLHFNNPMEAGLALQEILEEGDIVLVKGSQGMRMEKVVEEVMAEPGEKEKLLVRQELNWQKKPFVQP
ncbi:MAG TPA: UDP-N-acetylmuramoyl-tripeptide--D-alanyl-D-alanine ligase [Candidatus Moranbacteria bacterium]|nr:UDP-N-acetylmuramoyl-tripeptide--D-alanyl-D-alanine ligase [Candidatus Moranbacteria bacterium]